MSFLSILGDIAGIAGAPFTGGASLALTGLGIGGDIAGQIIGNHASNKAEAAQLNAIQQAAGQYNQGRQDTYNMLQGPTGIQGQNYDAQLGAYNDINSLNQPYTQGGQQAFISLTNAMNNGQLNNPTFNFDPSQVQNSPFFQATLDEGLKALQRSAAGKSRLFSGGTMKDVLNYAESLKARDYADEYNREFGLATQNYNAGRQNVSDMYNRYLGLTDVGTQAAGRVGAARTNLANEAQQSNEFIGSQLANLYGNTTANLANLDLQSGNVQAYGLGQRAGLLNTTLGNVLGGVGGYLGMRQARTGGYGTPTSTDTTSGLPYPY